MKIYNNVQHRPNFAGNFVKNGYILDAMERSDSIAKGAFENLLDRMKNTSDGYIFELFLNEDIKIRSKLFRETGVYKQFVLRIIDKTKKNKQITDKPLDTKGVRDDVSYKGILRQINRILKVFYDKPIEQLKEERRAKVPKDSIRFSNFVEDSDALLEEAELEKHNDLQQFDSFFRDEEIFNRKLDRNEKLNSPYDEDDVELSDSIKSHIFDALF